MSNNIGLLAMGEIVSFEVYPTAILGSGFGRVKVLAIVDKDTAANYIDPEALHVNVWPTLPNGVPNNPDEYYYVKVRLQSGQNTVIGLPWIRAESVVRHQVGTMVLRLENISAGDQTKVLQALSANGFNNVNVRIE